MRLEHDGRFVGITFVASEARRLLEDLSQIHTIHTFERVRINREIDACVEGGVPSTLQDFFARVTTAARVLEQKNHPHFFELCGDMLSARSISDVMSTRVSVFRFLMESVHRGLITPESACKLLVQAEDLPIEHVDEEVPRTLGLALIAPR